MILDRVTLKQGKTHCGRGLITDPIAHVVTDVDGDLEYNKLSGVESAEILVRLTSKYGSRVLLVTYTAIRLVRIATDKEIRS